MTMSSQIDLTCVIINRHLNKFCKPAWYLGQTVWKLLRNVMDEDYAVMLLESHQLTQSLCMSSGGSRISRRGGAPTSYGGCRLLTQLRFENFVCQCKRIWTLTDGGGVRAGGAPPPWIRQWWALIPLKLFKIRSRSLQNLTFMISRTWNHSSMSTIMF